MTWKPAVAASIWLAMAAPGLPPDAAAAPAAAVATAGAGLERFHDRLAEYGIWSESKTYGTVWMPKRVPHGWRPYANGRWIYTDVEWTWASDDPWGWATDHYGRWAYDPASGWIWVPGDVWAPAWVAWRWGGGYVGWAPLPPDANVESDVDLDVTPEPLAFCFVRQEFLADEHLAPRIERVAHNVTFLAAAKSVTRYTIGPVGGPAGGVESVVNHGVPVEEIEKASGHAVKRLPRPSADAPPPSKAELKAKAKKPEVETPRALGRRHVKERDALNAAEHDERKALELQHRQERATPPQGVYGSALRARHDAEDETQREHERREWLQLDTRQKREGLGKEPPPASAHHHHEPKHPVTAPPM
jgi:hypothetical protein